jgi:hypothetical protein
MDLKVYYQKLREIEAGLTDPHLVLVSLATPDGGRAGVATEAPRDIAAKMIVDGSARAATETEAQEYREKCQEACRAAEQASLARRIQVTVLSEPEARKPAGGSKGTKGQ